MLRPAFKKILLAVSAAVATVAANAAAAPCVGPPTLEAKARAHPDAQTFTALGSWFDAHHKYNCATGAYRSALKHDPGSGHILYLLGSSLYSAGDAEAAIVALQQSVTASPADLPPRLALANALEQRQHKDEAKAQWEEALKIDPHSVDALEGLSNHLIAEGNYASAIKLLQGVATNEELAANLVEAYGKGGSLELAADTAKKALQQTPDSFRLTSLLSSILVDLDRLEEARATAEKFATAHPGNLEAQRLFLRLLIATNDTVRAKPLARGLLAKAPHDAYFLYVNGMLEREGGEYAAARSHLQESVALDPTSRTAHYDLGLVLSKLNDLRGAKTEFEKAISLGVQEPEVHFQLSKVLKTLGEPDEAERQLKLYRDAADQQSKHSVAQAKTVLAEKELAAGDAQKAVSLYREALDSTPDDALLHFKTAMALDKTGDVTAEKDELEKAVRLDPDMAIAQNQLGYLDSRSGDAASAEEHFRQAVRAAPAYAEAWVNLAATLGMEQKIPEARQAVASALAADPTNANALQLQQDLNHAESKPQ